MSVNASVQIAVSGIKTKTQVPVIVKTNHVIVARQFLEQIMFLQANQITGKILNHHVVAIQLRVNLNAILDTREDFMVTVPKTISMIVIPLVSISAQLSKMPHSFVTAFHHVNHVCPVRAV